MTPTRPKLPLVDHVLPQRHDLYVPWASMLARCYNPDAPQYAADCPLDPIWHYFDQFVVDMSPRPGAEYELALADPTRGYVPGNCLWEPRGSADTSKIPPGVVRKRNGWDARFDHGGTRYWLGTFDTPSAAGSVQQGFVGLFFRDRAAALHMLPSPLFKKASRTGIRGVVPHIDGGFTARVHTGGVCKYLGYFKTVEEATAAVQRHRDSA